MISPVRINRSSHPSWTVTKARIQPSRSRPRLSSRATALHLDEAAPGLFRIIAIGLALSLAFAACVLLVP